MAEKKNDDVNITPTKVIKNNAIKTFVLVLILLFLVSCKNLFKIINAQIIKIVFIFNATLNF